MSRFTAIAICTLFSLTAPGLVGHAEDPFGDALAAEKKQAAAENPFGNAPAQAAKDDQSDHVAPALQARNKNNSHPMTEAEIREALDHVTKMEFTETPLTDAIDFLKDYHGIEIQLDNRALEEEGIGMDTPVTRNVSGLPLAAALRLLLEELGATFVVHHGVLVITTEKTALQKTDLRVYDISKLMSPKSDPVELGEVLQSVLPDARLLVRTAPAASPAAKSPSAVTIVAYRNLLIVRASLRDHDEIAHLLREFKDKLELQE